MIKRVCFVLISIFFLINSFAFASEFENTKILENSSKRALLQYFTEDYINVKDKYNPQVKFIYFIPQQLRNSKKDFPVIVLVPGFNGDAETILFPQIIEFAQKSGFGILVPSFKSNIEDFEQKKDYTYPEVWAGRALIRMLEKAKKNGLNYSNLYMFGFSAGAQFSVRFSYMYPEKVLACATIANGERFYPLYNNQSVKYFIAIGKRDIMDNRINARILDNYFNKLKVQHVYKEYDEEHGICMDEVIDILTFFQNVRKGRMGNL